MTTEKTVRCSSARVRRLLAGELAGTERADVSAHLLACETCRATERELAKEREALLRDVPFEVFASGVAERLAREKPVRNRWLRYAPLLAAACVLIVALPVALNRRAQTEVESGIRGKGGALAQLYVKDARGVHAWAPGEAIAENADVQAELKLEDKHAAAFLLEGGQAHVVFSGFARQASGKPRVVAFGWTGAHAARLVIVGSDLPIDASALQAGALATDPERWPGVVHAQSIDLPRAH